LIPRAEAEVSVRPSVCERGGDMRILKSWWFWYGLVVGAALAFLLVTALIPDFVVRLLGG